jgi:predicted butyrate kinase (DUF1464 family)
MGRAIGIDPGTLSFDVCGLDGERLFMDRTIPTPDLLANPQILLNLLQSSGPVDVIVGPSGYGLPWVKAQDLTPKEIDLLILSEKRDKGRNTIVPGMHNIIQMLQRSKLPIYFVPAVIHLSTVPAHRKVNRIDMGTADKLCAAALGVWEQSRRLEIGYGETSFIYVELGGAFTGILTVENGKVVDGLGGTSGGLGYQALGCMDGELAYILGSFHKEVLSSGGVAYIAGHPRMQPNELIALIKSDARCHLAWEAFFESLTKCVAAGLSSVSSVREILISGRLCRVPEISHLVTHRLSNFAPVHKMKGFGRVAKKAAQGAALIAEGLTGGIYKSLVDAMDLCEASGTVFDYLYIKGAERLREKYVKL